MTNGTKLNALPDTAGMVSAAHTISAPNATHWIGLGGVSSPPPSPLMPLRKAAM